MINGRLPGQASIVASGLSLTLAVVGYVVALRPGPGRALGFVLLGAYGLAICGFVLSIVAVLLRERRLGAYGIPLALLAGECAALVNALWVGATLGYP